MDNSLKFPSGFLAVLDNLERSVIVDKSTECKSENHVVDCRPTPVFVKRMEEETIIVNYNIEETIIESVRLKKRAGESELCELVEGKYYTCIPPEAYDEELTNKFVVQEKTVHGVSRSLRRKLRGESVLSFEEDEAQRKLQSTCTSYREVEVAVAVESSYCAYVGGEAKVDGAVATIMEEVSNDYEQNGLCWKVKVVYLEKFCDQATDPYRAGVSTNASGCGSTYGL